MTMVRFEGGTEHGKSKDVQLADYYVVPKRLDVAHVDEFRHIDVGRILSGEPRPLRVIKQFYRLEARRHPETGARDLVYVFEREEGP